MKEHGPQAIVLPSESNLDNYLLALEWRRAIVDRVSSWEELAALEKIHRAKIAMLTEQLESNSAHLKPWELLELEGKIDRETAATRKCLVLMDQLERETRAWHLKLKATMGDG